MLRLTDSSDWFELDLANQETKSSSYGGDAYLTLIVHSSGFSGHNDIWVSGDSLTRFCRQLLNLEATRQGAAELKGISPNELSLTIRSVDSLGHMIVEGHTGYNVSRSVTRPRHAVHFGIEFDPSQLAQVRKLPWIATNA